jgi:hypothetical protein
MLLEINVKNSSKQLPHSAIAEKITFSTHNTLCFFHKFYIRTSDENISAIFTVPTGAVGERVGKGKFVNISAVTCFTL